MDGTHVWHASTDAAWTDRDRVDRALRLARRRRTRARYDGSGSTPIARCSCSAGRWRARSSAARSAWRRPRGSGARARTAGRRSPRRRRPCTSISRTAPASSSARCRARPRRSASTSRISRSSQTDPALVARYCRPGEAADRRGAAPTAGAIGSSQYWTLKEAYLKARGLGIAVPLADICFALDADGIRIEFLGSLAGTDAGWTFHLERLTDRAPAGGGGAGRRAASRARSSRRFRRPCSRDAASRSATCTSVIATTARRSRRCPRIPDDWLIVAGDVGERPEHLVLALEQLTREVRAA